MKRKPWYIWFSIFAFVILWATTEGDFESTWKDKHKFNLWLKALGNGIKLMILFFIFPIAIFPIAFEHLTPLFPQLIPAREYIEIGILYFVGVYITYRLAFWRAKNMPPEA